MSRIFSFIKKLNLSQSCSLFVASFVFITGLILSFISWSNLNNQLSATQLKSIHQQLQRLTISIAPSLLLHDRISLNVTLQEWTKASEINFIRVLNTSHQAIAEAGQQKKNSIEITQSITQDNLAIGTIKAEANLSTTEVIVSRHLALGLTITVFFTLLAALTTYYTCDRYTGYLAHLSTRVNQWRSDKSIPLSLPEPPSLPELHSVHSAMSEVVEYQGAQDRLASALAQFDQLSTHLHSDLRYAECAILLVQVRNIEDLKKNHDAQVLANTLNEHYQLLTQACKLYGGRLQAVAGGGSVALFGLSKQDAMHAVFAAQLFLGSISEQVNDRPTIEYGLAGHLGKIVRSTTQPEHHLMSDNLEWTASLLANANPAQLCISQSLHNKVVDNQQATWLEAHSLTNFNSEQESTWQLKSLSEKQQALINRQIRHITSTL